MYVENVTTPTTHISLVRW